MPVERLPCTVVFRGEAEERDRRGRAAQGGVERGQVSRARQELTGAALAPKTRETLEELQRKRSQRPVQEIPAEVVGFMPQSPVTLNARVLQRLSAERRMVHLQVLEGAVTRCSKSASMTESFSSC